MSADDHIIPLSEPDLGGNEARYLLDCISSGYVSSVGPYVDRFEAAVAELAGAESAVAVSSGTAALQMALLALDVEPGSEVWIPSLTFIATANAVVHAGATPVLVDSSALAMDMDPDLIEDELRRRTRAGEALPAALIPVHLYGEPADLRWNKLAAEYGVRVVEDAAEAVGSKWAHGDLAGLGVGTAGAAGCFSFNGNKTVTAGGGGVVVGALPLTERVRHLSTQARIPGTDYEHDAVGFNHRLTNLCAAVGLAQLERLDEISAARRTIHERYVEEVALMEGIDCIRWSDQSNCWLTVVTFDSLEKRDQAKLRLHEARVLVRRTWPALHNQKPYRNARLIGSGKAAEAWSAAGLCLPSSPTLAASDQDRVLSVLADPS